MKPINANWKAADVIGRVRMFLIPLFIPGHCGGIVSDKFLEILLMVGGWQFLSMMIHLAFLKARWVVIGRKIYYILISIVGVAGLVAAINHHLVFGYFYALLFAGSALGVAYFIVSITEWIKMNNLNASRAKY